MLRGPPSVEIPGDVTTCIRKQWTNDNISYMRWSWLTNYSRLGFIGFITFIRCISSAEHEDNVSNALVPLVSICERTLHNNVSFKEMHGQILPLAVRPVGGDKLLTQHWHIITVWVDMEIFFFFYFYLFSILFHYDEPKASVCSSSVLLPHCKCAAELLFTGTLKMTDEPQLIFGARHHQICICTLLWPRMFAHV